MMTRTRILLALGLATAGAAGGWTLLCTGDCGTELVEESLPPDPAVGADLYAQMQMLSASDARLAALNEEEQAIAELQETVLSTLREGIERRDAARIQGLVSGSLQWGLSQRAQESTQDGIERSSWSGGNLTEWLGSYDDVEWARVDVRRSARTQDGLALTLWLDVRGLGHDGQRQTDRGEMELSVRRADSGWEVASLTSGAGEHLRLAAGRLPTFADATDHSGLDQGERFTREEAIRRGGYALAVADFDGDHRPDVLMGHMGSMQLLRNTTEGFVDVTVEAGLESDDVVKAAAFADLDNDGQRDLVLARFDIRDDNQRDDIVIYRNLGEGRFERRDEVLPVSRQYDFAMPLALADFDNNGWLDLYVGFPGAQDFTNDLADGAQAGVTAQGLWLNRGDWQFAEVTEQVGDPGRVIYPHSALVTDLDSDGDPDLMVIDDSELDSLTYLNEDGGHLQPQTERTGLQSGGYGMSAAAADYDGDGLVDIAITRIELLAARRISDSWSDRVDDAGLQQQLTELGEDLSGLVLYRNQGDGTFEDVSGDAGLAWSGEAPAGATFVDYNTDGWMDIYVSNGLWSAGETDVGSDFVRMTLAAQNSADDDDEMLGAAEDTLGHPVDEREGSDDPNPFLTMLRARPELSFGGDEANRLFRNNGDGTFTEVGYLEAADRREDGYVAAAADFDGDGATDLLLRNCDPAPTRTYPAAILLRNQRLAGQSLAIHLSGVASNRDGVGARVTAWVGDRVLVREVQSTAGAIQSEPAAVFGLGEAEQIDRLEVLWPSGQVDRFGPILPGRAQLTEGSGALRPLAAR